MGRTVPTLGDLEIVVLRMIWEEQPCTERQIWELVRRQREVARTTVLKTMQRLEAKNLLVRLPGSSPVQYRAVIQQQRLLPKLVKRFVEGTLGGSFTPLVNCLAESHALSAKDLAALRAIARRLERSESSEGDGESA